MRRQGTWHRLVIANVPESVLVGALEPTIRQRSLGGAAKVTGVTAEAAVLAAAGTLDVLLRSRGVGESGEQITLASCGPLRAEVVRLDSLAAQVRGEPTFAVDRVHDPRLCALDVFHQLVEVRVI